MIKTTPALLLLMMCSTESVAMNPPPDSISEDPVIQELRTQIATLQKEVSDLRQNAGQQWLTEQRSEEIRGIVQDVLADADTRASLLSQGISAGHDGKFFLASADGSFRLNFGGQIMFRYTANNQDEGGLIDDEYRSGFSVRRGKLKFTGHVVDPSWKFELVGAFDNDDGDIGSFTSQGDLDLEDGNITKVLDNGWSVKFGQFKGPFMREELVSSSRQLTADRTLVNEKFNQDRSTGIQLGYEADAFRFSAMYSDGSKELNHPWAKYDTEFAIMGRAEFLLSGSWKQFKDFTSLMGSEYAVMVGVGAIYEKEEYGVSTGPNAGPEEEEYRLTADVSFEGDGWNVFIAGVYQDLDVAGTSPWGIVAQGGYYTAEDFELFARYEYGDSDDGSADEDLGIFTAGFNKYFSKHTLKWTTDLGYGFDPVSGFWNKLGVGWRPDATGKDGQLVLRSQLQLLF